MSYESQKKEVIKFFDDYIFNYLIPDIRTLQRLEPDTRGRGACTIPLAITTFTAVDLFGYFLDPNSSAPAILTMKLKVFLSSKEFFPELKGLTDLDNFLDSFRQDVRSLMTHRFFLTQYHIAKLPEKKLFVDHGVDRIFNATHFANLVTEGIQKVYDKIHQDSLILAGDTNKEETMQRLYDRLQNLKNYVSPELAAAYTEGHISDTNS